MKKIVILFILAVMTLTTTVCAAGKTYEYDDSGRITKVTYEDGSYETYEYDKNGNIIQVVY
ncbi:MAG: RHS repeat protein, partial [Lachnospiraceae bacterium]|nr:RHS repeat protein [Lachnospiraceae bacterium]